MRALQEYTRLKADADEPDDLSWLLVLDAMIFQAEAEIRWLDHCEASLVAVAACRRRQPRPLQTPVGTDATDTAPAQQRGATPMTTADPAVRRGRHPTGAGLDPSCDLAATACTAPAGPPSTRCAGVSLHGPRRASWSR